jgi:pyruvate formate lyase activating enzyme
MKIGGIIDISTKDIPGSVCMVLFTVGCNFNCGFCHNKHLLVKGAGKKYSVQELTQLAKSNYLVNSVSITGGEPTLQPDIAELCKALKELGKYVSIDTNGSHPEIIEMLIPYLNRVALDLKGSLTKENYKKITGTEIDPALIKKTLDLVNNNEEINLEIRTTFVEKLLRSEDIHSIIQYLRNINFKGTFVLQQYQYSEGVGEKFQNQFKKPQHNTLLKIIKPYLDKDLSFNIYIRDDIEAYAEIHEIFEKII